MQGANSKIITPGSLATQMLKDTNTFTSFGGDVPFRNPLLQERIGSGRLHRNSSQSRHINGLLNGTATTTGTFEQQKFKSNRNKVPRGASYNGPRKTFGASIENNINLNKLGNDIAIANLGIQGESKINIASTTAQANPMSMSGQGAWRKADNMMAKNKILTKKGRPPTGRDSFGGMKPAPNADIGVTGQRIGSSSR
jgi:hypothetical protein